eukprot:TRINITY_DN3607_c0_g6_i2.p1 TRINITY_DN3607_c0_g6~~TRINITY_DN3607_c0_g6_i2.p1  ORF type:complete len:300 (+),score=56.83 TRINITY_DN3607_c0_g6_i2:267-1166(+)
MPSQPGFQWDDAGGYCGSWATQRVTLAKGAWISQQQVRAHTSPCGGHDNEILSCNIEEALTNLKIDFEGFNYKSTPLPQTEAYFAWLKAHLAGGNAVAWMIMWSGQEYPIYNLTPPAGMYGHVEPVIGIQSSHPLNHTQVYDDDTVLHFTDGGVNTVHRRITSLPGTWGGVGQQADCGAYSYCIGNPYGFGWAVKGFTPDSKQAVSVPASLRVDPWRSEPDTRSGQAPTELKGTLTVTGLIQGESYAIYRWDGVGEAFADYSDKWLRTSFRATNGSFVYVDDKSFKSDGTTYYRAIKAE